MHRDQLPPHKSATYVLPRWKVVYVAVPKAACTSLKWVLAGLQGESAERFYSALTREVGRAMTIHRRRSWKRTAMLHRLTDAELAEISPENGWFVFTVTRHPTARLWSAWQSKLLLREPKWVERFAHEPWFPRIPSSTDDVVDDFQAFARSLAADPDQAVLRDRHFHPQTGLIAPGRTPYTKIYRASEIPALIDDLSAQLRSCGWEGELKLPESNETPLRPLAAMFTDDVNAAIARVYRSDFDELGYAGVVPDKLDPAGAYDASALRALGSIAERAERIGDLALRAQRLNAARAAKQREIEELRRRLGPDRRNGAHPHRFARKVRRGVSRALNRV